MDIAYSFCNSGDGFLVFWDVFEEDEAVGGKLLESEEQDFVIFHIIFVWDELDIFLHYGLVPKDVAEVIVACSYAFAEAR